jgi:hypothetical protein
VVEKQTFLVLWIRKFVDGTKNTIKNGIEEQMRNDDLEKSIVSLLCASVGAKYLGRKRM